MPRESQIVESICRLLKQRNVWFVKHHGHREGRAGVPDITACYQGLFIALEVKKSEKEEPTKLQQYEIERIRQAGGTALVVWTKSQVVDLLDSLGFDE